MARNPMRAVQAIHESFGTVWSMPALSRKYVRRKRRDGRTQTSRSMPETASQNGENVGKDKESSSTKILIVIIMTLEQVWDLALKGLSKNGERKQLVTAIILRKHHHLRMIWPSKRRDRALDVSIDIGKAGAAKDTST